MRITAVLVDRKDRPCAWKIGGLLSVGVDSRKLLNVAGLELNGRAVVERCKREPKLESDRNGREFLANGGIH